MARTTFRGVAVVLALTVGALGAGCADTSEPSSPPDPLASAASPIKGGYADSTDTAVVGIMNFRGGMCSGSLIAPNLVLTAQHCVAPTRNQVNGGVDCSQTDFGAPHAADSFFVTTDAVFSREGNFYRASEVIVPSSNKICGADVALIVLSDSIPEAEAKPLIPRVDSRLTEKLEYFAVGYGETDDGNGQSGARRRRDGLFIECVGNDCPAYMGGMKNEFLGDTGICSGDSGGPAIDLQQRVIGVTSRGGAGCVYPIYGDVERWGEWIKEQALHAAEVGGYEAAPWATGAPTDPVYEAPIGGECEVPADCETGLCLNDGVASYCTRPCEEAAACPEGYRCDLVNGTDPFCFQEHDEPEPEPGAGAGGGSGEGGGGGGPSNPADPGGETSVSCSMNRVHTDPTKPIPWLTGFALAGALAVSRRRRR